MLFGVDVSEFQGNINWDQLNAVANFVLIRSSFGTQRQDYKFQRNQAEAHRVQAAAGPLGIGYYYFAYPTLIDPISSADYFVDNLGDYRRGEILALDLEGNIGSDPVGWSLAFLQHVEARLGVKPVIYLNQSEVNGYNWSSVINGDFGLWLADYDGNKTGVGPVTPWPVTAIRQWTDKDQVAGIPGDVDGNVFYGDFSTWSAYGGQVAAPTSDPAPQPSPAEPPAAPPVEAPAPPPQTIDPTLVPVSEPSPAAPAPDAQSSTPPPETAPSSSPAESPPSVPAVEQPSAATELPTSTPAAEPTPPAPTTPPDWLPVILPSVDLPKVSPDSSNASNDTPTPTVGQAHNGSMKAELTNKKLWVTVLGLVFAISGAAVGYLSSGQATSLVGLLASIFVSVQAYENTHNGS